MQCFLTGCLCTARNKIIHPHYENIVIDYQSTIVIHNDEHTLSKVDTFFSAMPEINLRPVSEPNSPIKDYSHLKGPRSAVQLPIHTPHDNPGLFEPESDHATKILPETSVLVRTESHASIEPGVAKLEIMYQQNLKCIAMSSNGWRCPAIIHEEQLLKARELLSSSANSEAELDMELLSRSVLCSGHVLGDLPRIYSEKWATFAEQRLPKEEAMLRFHANSGCGLSFSHTKCGMNLDLKRKRIGRDQLPIYRQVGATGTNL